MNGKYNIKITDRAEKAFKKIAKEDKRLFSEINQRINYLSEGKFEQLDIVSIIRKKGKYKIKEIRIFNPGSYRVFYIHISSKNNEILIIDGKKKKVDKFNDNYFKCLDECIEYELND